MHSSPCPADYGTFEEFFEILTWAQIGLHKKPIGLLNLRNYYAPLLEMVELARKEGFIYEEHLTLFHIHADPESLIGCFDKPQTARKSGTLAQP